MDLPAKAMLLNIKQFNGVFGCVSCFHPGQRAVNTTVYPYDKDVKYLTIILILISLYLKLLIFSIKKKRMLTIFIFRTWLILRIKTYMTKTK